MNTTQTIVGHLKLVAGDTDGLALKKVDQSAFSAEERTDIIRKLNEVMPELIRFEDEGVLKRQIVVKVKNYVMQDETGKVKIKGSGLKATTKEKALQRFTREVIDLLLKDRKDQIYSLYLQYAEDVTKLKSIDDWCSKKTVTKAVLSAVRTNERRVLEALDGSDYVEGDKVFMFFKTPEQLCLKEKFDGTYDIDILLDKLWSTLAVFETILDIDLFPNFSLKRNRMRLSDYKYSDGGLLSKLRDEAAPISFPLGLFQTRAGV